jgi:hypothetical protein
MTARMAVSLGTQFRNPPKRFVNTTLSVQCVAEVEYSHALVRKMLGISGERDENPCFREYTGTGYQEREVRTP